MTSDRLAALRRLLVVGTLAFGATALAVGCGDGTGPGASIAAPDTVRAIAIGPSAIRVEWSAVPGAASYRLERRADLAGPFTVIAAQLPATDGTVTYFDTDLEPERFYGYRVVALATLGGQSRRSTVAGDRTAPAPGVAVSILTVAPTPSALDPDGFQVWVRRGTDSTMAVMGPVSSRRFSPLVPGTYAVTLRGLASNCSAQQPTLPAAVPEDGVATLVSVQFRVDCVDATRGRIVAEVALEGQPLDPDGFDLSIAGLADDATLPDTARVFAERLPVSTSGGTVVAGNLRPGQYDVKLEDVQSPCTVRDAGTRRVQVAALRSDTVRFTVVCESGGGTGGRPLVLRSLWTPQSAAPGAKVALTVSMDLSGRAGLTIGNAAGQVQFPAAALRYDSVQAITFPGQSVNSAIPGELSWISFATSISNPPSGVVPLLRFHFTVTGAAGTTAATRSRVSELLEGDGATLIDTALVRAVEDTLAIATGGGGGTTNQPPTARANGPYAGSVGQAIAFSSSGSADADGTIASWAWSFGDGTTSTQANPSKAYAAAGSYTATLTVTDDRGATATSQAQVTVSGGGGTTNQPPTARANGPYTGTAGQPIAFSSSGSSDPDGSIASYAWSFGDGTTSTQASPPKTYAAAGTYTATLTVTDNGGLTASSQATVTVTAAGGGGGSTPFTWANGFGTVNLADSTVRLTITLDLSTNIAETPGVEELETFVLDSLKWDPAVLRFWALNWGPGGGGSFQSFGNATGKLVLRSNPLPAQNRSGVITIATVTFKLVGTTAGRTTTTQTTLGPLLGTTATGGFNYRSRTRVQEGSFTTP